MWSLAWLPAAAFHRAEPPLQLRKELRRGVSRPLHPHPRSAIRLKFSRSCLFEEEAIAICISACFILISTSRAPGNGFRWGKYSLRKRSVRNPLSGSATVHGRLPGQNRNQVFTAVADLTNNVEKRRFDAKVSKGALPGFRMLHIAIEEHSVEIAEYSRFTVHAL